MLYKLGGAIKTGLSKFRDFYTKNKKQIYLSLFMLSLHPHYSKFTYKHAENSDKIENFLTLEEANERKNSISNISYKILFDFSNEESEKDKNLFKIKGKIIILFDFNACKYPNNKKHLKLDYQGKIISVNLDDKLLKINEDFYVNEKETKENFGIQEKNCVFINKNNLKEKQNKLLIEFSSEYSEEFRSKEINNPFLLMDHPNEQNKSKPIKVILK